MSRRQEHLQKLEEKAQCRLQGIDLQDGKAVKAIIPDLHALGLPAANIARLVGRTRQYVGQVIDNADTPVTA